MNEDLERAIGAHKAAECRLRWADPANVAEVDAAAWGEGRPVNEDLERAIGAHKAAECRLRWADPANVAEVDAAIYRLAAAAAEVRAVLLRARKAVA